MVIFHDLRGSRVSCRWGAWPRLQWLLTQRIRRAQELLETTDDASTPSPRPRAWARRRHCAATSTARSTYRRTPTAARSGREAAAARQFAQVRISLVTLRHQP